MGRKAKVYAGIAIAAIVVLATLPDATNLTGRGPGGEEPVGGCGGPQEDAEAEVDSEARALCSPRLEYGVYAGPRMQIQAFWGLSARLGDEVEWKPRIGCVGGGAGRPDVGPVVDYWLVPDAAAPTAMSYDWTLDLGHGLEFARRGGKFTGVAAIGAPDPGAADHSRRVWSRIVNVKACYRPLLRPRGPTFADPRIDPAYREPANNVRYELDGRTRRYNGVLSRVPLVAREKKDTSGRAPKEQFPTSGGGTTGGSQGSAAGSGTAQSSLSAYFFGGNVYIGRLGETLRLIPAQRACREHGSALYPGNNPVRECRRRVRGAVADCFSDTEPGACLLETIGNDRLHELLPGLCAPGQGELRARVIIDVTDPSPLAVESPYPPEAWPLGVFVRRSIRVRGGTPDGNGQYAFSLHRGDLPAGARLDEQSGRLSGTIGPGAPHDLVIRVRDTEGRELRVPYTLRPEHRSATMACDRRNLGQPCRVLRHTQLQAQNRSVDTRGIPNRLYAYDTSGDLIGGGAVPRQGKAPWVAIHRFSGGDAVLYSSSDNTNTVQAYLPTIESQAATLVDHDPYDMIFAYEIELDRTLPAIQGGVVSDNGYLYLTAAANQGGQNDDNAGLYIFKVEGRTGDLVHFIPAGCSAAGCYSTGAPEGDELEGLTIWDVAGRGAPGIPRGQIHVVWLNNDIPDVFAVDDIYEHFDEDNVTIMHYSIFDRSRL